MQIEFYLVQIEFYLVQIEFHLVQIEFHLLQIYRHEKGEQVTFIRLNFWSFIVSIKTCTYQKISIF